MSTLGIKYNVKKTLAKPDESQPLDVEAIERQIEELEQKQETSKENTDNLVEMYKKVIYNNIRLLIITMRLIAPSLEFI